MSNKRVFLAVILVILALTTTISGCNLPTSVVYQDNPDVVLQNTAAASTIEALLPGEQEEVATLAAPTTMPESSEVSPAPIQHLNMPDIKPPGEPQVIHDQESIRKAAEREAYGGDEFPLGRYERPFDQEMKYIPVIDIKQANLFRDKDDEFIYTVILLMENPALFPEEKFGFGIELDLDIDGRGDVLIWTEKPPGTEWTVDGVTVWKDINKDIGERRPMRSDPPPGGDGYEINIFNAGVGADPDLAWARISMDDPRNIEIAFKSSLLDNTEKFMWGAWAILGADQFDLFDHHDHYTFADAGSPTKSDTKYYPLKDMYALDNSCRAASGFAPKGNEPGLCPAPIPQPGEPETKPGPTEPPPEEEPQIPW